MKCLPSRIGAAAWLLAIGVHMASNAGQAQSPNSPMESMNLEQMRAYQAFYYRSGGRDPMTMRQPTARELGTEAVATSIRIAPTLAQMEQTLKNALSTVESAFAKRDYDEALKQSEEAIRMVDYDWPPLQADPPQLRRMDEQIRNYTRLASTLKAKEEVYEEFSRLSFHVAGVSWSPTGARAMINNRLVEAGESLLDIRPTGDLRVESIEPRAVVFQYKGFRFRNDVDLYSERPVDDNK
jgi:hypothetical protein